MSRPETARHLALARLPALCKFNDVTPVRRGQFKARLEAAGYRYSRSRRIDGVQQRTWEGIALRRKPCAA